MAFYQIVPKFCRRCQPIYLRLGREMCSKPNKDIEISTPWRRHGPWGRRHSPWDGFLPDVFRGVGPFRGGKGPFEEFEDMMRRMEKMMTPRFFDHYYVRPRHFAEAARSEVEQVRYDGSAFEVKIDVQHYSPEELNVKLQGNTLTITGKHEQKQDEHGYISRQFHREFEIPEDVNLESFESTVSEDGIMTLRADVKGTEKPEEKKINIKFEPKKEDDKKGLNPEKN